MAISEVDPPSPKPRPSLVVQFARFWSANMDLVHSKGQSWPGFSYTDEEKAAMHRIATAMGGFEFFVAMALAVIFTLIVAGLTVTILFWRLSAKYGSDPSRTPEAEFYFTMALAIITTVAGGLPLSILAGSWITGRLITPAQGSLPDPDFARRLFRKAMRQIVQMGSIACIALLIYWLFVPRNSKLDLLVQAIGPTLGPVAAVLSSLYYFSGRVTDTGSPGSSEVEQGQIRKSEEPPRP